MTKLSVVMICYNEEENLSKSLSSVSWADEIVVVDSFSKDKTMEIARTFTSKVYQHAWEGYGKQKNFAMIQSTCPWILSLDADEVVSPELAREIQYLLTKGPEKAGYHIPRMTSYLGEFLRHTWYPDYKIRLFERDRARWGEEEVHETISLDGSLGKLKNPLLHYSFPTLRDHLETIQLYTTLGAEELIGRGKRFSVIKLLGNPLAIFLKQYILKRGFMDGVPGFVASVFSVAHVFIKYAKLYEIEKKGLKKGSKP